MADPLIHVLALALYLGTGLLLLQNLLHGRTAVGGARMGILGLGLGAILLHAAILYKDMLVTGGLDLGFMSAASLVAGVVATLFLAASVTKPLDNLGIVIMPLAGLIVIAAWIWPGGHIPVTQDSGIQSLHIVISILAYSLLCLAVVQSLLLLIQERHLHQKHPGGFLRALPPMQTMEDLMFQMIAIGFLLLTLTLLSGIFFSEELFDKPLRFTHHIVLSSIAWVVFAILLFGRWRLGWRGRVAVGWTLGGFALLLLAYFGSKFVLEILLGRT